MIVLPICHKTSFTSRLLPVLFFNSTSISTLSTSVIVLKIRECKRERASGALKEMGKPRNPKHTRTLRFVQLAQSSCLKKLLTPTALWFRAAHLHLIILFRDVFLFPRFENCHFSKSENIAKYYEMRHCLEKMSFESSTQHTTHKRALSISQNVFG